MCLKTETHAELVEYESNKQKKSLRQCSNRTLQLWVGQDAS